MKRQFKYPKHFEEQKKIPKITQKRIKLAEVSLGDFEGRLENELLNWFSLTPQHWIMLHMVMLAYYKNKSIKLWFICYWDLGLIHSFAVPGKVSFFDSVPSASMINWDLIQKLICFLAKEIV